MRYGDKLGLDHVTFRAVPGWSAPWWAATAQVGPRSCAAWPGPTRSAAAGRLLEPLRIGYLSAGSGTYPDLSVDENLAFRASAYRMPAAAARERSREFVERAGLAGARDRLAGQLSGGMRQKLGVIAAMLHQPDLLVLDEPTTGVDPVSRADLWWLIARAAADGAAVVLATSYLDEAERAVEVLALDAGRVLATGTPQEIIAAMPGTLRVSDARPEGEDRRRSWRRGGRWRIWDPRGHPGRAASSGTSGAVAPDLQDAVTVAILARELARAGELAAAGPAGGQPEGDGSR